VSPPSVTAIVVSAGLETMLRFCLESLGRALARLPGVAHRIVVVDDASTTPYLADDLGAEVELLRFDLHRSFARANNLAAERVPNDLYLLLNNDVLLAETALERAAALLERAPSAGICGSRLLFPNGTIQHCGVVFADGTRGPYHFARGRPARTVARANREWQAVTGACMLVRRAVWEDLGGLDEFYPFGLEDVDFCLRARIAGWRVLCCDDVDSLHFESLTPGRAARDVDSRRLFLSRWRGRYGIDG
jgi:GT2 family glycosyltransferase